MTNLPFKLQKNLFSYLEKTSDITQCQLTCKLWKQAATEALYATIKIGSKNDKLISSLKTHQKFGKLVKKVDLGFGSKKESVGDMQHILEYCPNTENISAYNADEDVWPVIRNASKNGQLKHVKYSPDGGRGVDSDTLFLFRNSLKEFFLSDSTAQRGPNNSAFRLISQRLDEFPNLTKLFTLLKTNRDMLPEFDSLIQDCPNLR